MREIVVISGKGGAGKTSLTGAFAHLAGSKVLCDLDVDAPDLHLLLAPQILRREDFISGFEALIDQDACTACGVCADMCRFDAVVERHGAFAVDPLRCEGCGVCEAFCPTGAARMAPRHCGEWYVSRTRFGTMAHARLFPGSENSGRLVSLLKQKARELAKEEGKELVLCDGAPGIGCPVISSLSGVSLAVAVTEPTPSGIHDLERVCGLCDHFRVPVAVIVNKWDLNPEMTMTIETMSRERGCSLAGRLLYDRIVTETMAVGQAVTERPDSPFAGDVRRIWARIEEFAGVSRRVSL